MNRILQIARLKGTSRQFAPLLGSTLLLSACRWSDTLLTQNDTSVCANYTAMDAGQGSGPIAAYSCESAAGAADILPDTTGHGYDATLHSDLDAGVGYSFAPGKTGNALDFSQTNQGYLALPTGLLTGACEATIATWVYINSASAWMRVWDFGRDTNVYMFLTPMTNYDGHAKFAITVNGRKNEQAMEAPSSIPATQWTHVAVVLGPLGSTLYFDGAPVADGPAITLRPADLGATMNNYVGRSQFTEDPYLDGNVDELRVYDRALSSDEIQALANGAL